MTDNIGSKIQFGPISNDLDARIIKLNPNPAITFGGTVGFVVTLRFDPPSVEIAPGVDLDDAARAFWNAVCRVRRLPAPFPEEGGP